MAAERKGRVAVFLARDGALGLGHVGWGVETGSDDWVYGSMNPLRRRDMWLPGNNGAWEERGSFEEMTGRFAGGGKSDGYSFLPGYYTQYKVAEIPAEGRVPRPGALRTGWNGGGATA